MFKRTLNFIFLRQAFTSRNLVSLLLVGFLFVVYYLSGGKVIQIPKLDQAGTFGGVRAAAPLPETSQKSVDSRMPSSLASDSEVRKTAPAVGEVNQPDASSSLSRVEERLKNLGSKNPAARH
jgi:hypothetical protein